MRTARLRAPAGAARPGGAAARWSSRRGPQRCWAWASRLQSLLLGWRLARALPLPGLVSPRLPTQASCGVRRPHRGRLLRCARLQRQRLLLQQAQQARSPMRAQLLVLRGSCRPLRPLLRLQLLACRLTRPPPRRPFPRPAPSAATALARTAAARAMCPLCRCRATCLARAATLLRWAMQRCRAMSSLLTRACQLRRPRSLRPLHLLLRRRARALATPRASAHARRAPRQLEPQFPPRPSRLALPVPLARWGLLRQPLLRAWRPPQQSRGAAACRVCAAGRGLPLRLLLSQWGLRATRPLLQRLPQAPLQRRLARARLALRLCRPRFARLRLPKLP